MRPANQSPSPEPPPAAPRHFHLGGTEENYGTYWSQHEAEAAVAEQALRWISRYGAEAVHADQGYVAVWRRGVRIDYRTAFACANPHCAPGTTPPGRFRRARRAA